MATFKYATTGGQMKTFEAADQKAAISQLSSFGDADPNSGVMAVQNNSTPSASFNTLASNPSPLTVNQQAQNATAPNTGPFTPSITAPGPEVDPYAESLNKLSASLDTGLSNIEGLTNQIGSAPQRRQELETQAGLPAINQRLTELQSIDAQYAADLNNIASQNMVNQLKQEGRIGADAAHVQGQQGQFNRQAIIQQQNVNIQRSTNAALIASAQGQLSLAQDYVNRALDYEFKPLEAQLEFQRFIYQENKDRFSQIEQRQFEARLRKEEKEIAEQKELRTNLQNFMLEAYQAGADIRTINKIKNAKSIEEAINIAGSAGIFTPKASAAAPTIKSINGVDMQWNPQTGQWEQIPGASAPGISGYSAERAFRTVQSVDELLDDAVANPGIFGRSAAAPIPLFLRSDAYRNFNAQLDTLKSNIAFNELTAMREASKTGGALGQVSDREGQLLQSALGALSMTQSPEEFQTQLRKIKASIQRWRKAVEENGGFSPQSQASIITAPDGTLVEIID